MAGAAGVVLQKGRRRSGAIISNCRTPTLAGDAGFHGCGMCAVGHGAWYMEEDMPTIDDTCGISRLMQGSLSHGLIWQPTRPHNYRYRLDFAARGTI